MYENYTTVIRNGVEHEVYDWTKGEDKSSFEAMLHRWGSDTQRFCYISATNQYYVINKQERTVMEIKNEEVKKFFYHVIQGTNINETYIDLFIKIGGFEMTEYV